MWYRDEDLIDEPLMVTKVIIKECDCDAKAKQAALKLELEEHFMKVLNNE